MSFPSGNTVKAGFGIPTLLVMSLIGSMLSGSILPVFPDGSVQRRLR
jgi:hypothetical protein